MATLETKFNIGDVVFHAGMTTERKQHPCPDCLGERKWKAVTPAGSEFEFRCPRCSASYMSDHGLSLAYSAHVPSVQRLTIGSISYNTAKSSWDEGARYMCVETGVGSGTVYNEDRLFADEAAALRAAQAAADEKNRTFEPVVQLYNKTLEISDYQLESAKLKLASESESHARSMLYNLSDLFASIEEAADKDAIMEVIAEYRSWSWDRDLKAARDSDGSGEAGETGTGSTEGDSATSEGGIAQ